MRKAVKLTVIISTGIILLALIGRCFYMIACLSCTYPPIKVYEYQGSIDQLELTIQKFVLSNPDVKYKISRRDSTIEEDNGDRDLTIELKRDTSTTSYGFVCEPGTNNTDVKLVSAFSKNNSYGGYTINAPGVRELLSNFENGFLVRLRKEQHVILKPE